MSELPCHKRTAHTLTFRWTHTHTHAHTFYIPIAGDPVLSECVSSRILYCPLEPMALLAGAYVIYGCVGYVDGPVISDCHDDRIGLIAGAAA